MRAFVQTGYGCADVIESRALEAPSPAAGEVVVRVRAASVAAGDVFLMRGSPFPARISVGFPKPKPNYVVGLDFAGTVTAVGAGVTAFGVGDEVFGECHGSCAEFARASVERIAAKPRSASFDVAAAVPASACTALQGLRDQGHVTAGKHVLVNGASGGVGTFAVQIAHAFGAEVTGVCSTRNVELVRSLGADHVIDYTKQDFTEGGARFDVIMDNVASHSPSEARRALKPDGIHVPSSGHGGMRWIIAAALSAPFSKRQAAPFVATASTRDLTTLAAMIDEGTLTPMIDKVYPFEKCREAFRYLDGGHARGKVVISVDCEAP